jgi:hypothetical protein
MTIINELVRIWQVAVVPKLEVISLHLLEVAEKNYKTKSQSK